MWARTYLSMGNTVANPDDDQEQHNGSIYHDARDTLCPEEVPDEATVLRQQLADETRLRKYTEQVLDERQSELQLQEAEYQRLTVKLDALRNELADTRDQLKESRNQVRSKEEQLLEANDQIFSLQPTRKDITESEAIEAFRSLCANIKRWVENRLQGILDELDMGRLKHRPSPPLQESRRLIFMMRDAARRGISLDQSDEYHVTAIIMSYLCHIFFSRSFYCVLDDFEGENNTIEFIDSLENSMSQYRDVAHCKEWRSETLTAFTSQNSFKARRTRYIDQVSEDFAELLSIIVPKSSTSDIQRSLRRNIVEPAAELAHRLYLAPSMYSLKWPAKGASERLEVYECCNLANNGLNLNLSGTSARSASRRRVTYLFDILPGLFVERVELGKKTQVRVLCRPTVLVHGGDGEVAQKPTVLKWLWDHCGGAPSKATMSSSTKVILPPQGKRR